MIDCPFAVRCSSTNGFVESVEWENIGMIITIFGRYSNRKVRNIQSFPLDREEMGGERPKAESCRQLVP